MIITSSGFITAYILTLIVICNDHAKKITGSIKEFSNLSKVLIGLFFPTGGI